MQSHKEPYRDRIELLQGTLDLLILTTLQWGPQHGYAISLAIKANSGDVLQVETGSLYPALHRLEKAALGRERVEANRGQPARQVLPSDCGWEEAACG